MKTQPPMITGDGGNEYLVNQDECQILDRTIQAVPMVVAPGGADDFSHVNPVFRETATRPVDY